MEIFGFLAIFFLLKYLYEVWKTGKEERKRLEKLDVNACLYNGAKDNLENEKTMELTIGTRDLFLDTLSKIGCQYELGETEEDSDKIYFTYQGENFTASANNEGWYVHIWDTYWGHVELCDIDELARLKKAINLSNMNCATMTVYTVDEAGSNVDVLCKSVIPFIPQIPEIDKYLRGELNDFFLAHQYVGNEMAKQREAENVL